MRIVQAIPSMNAGGAERVVLNYAEFLPRHGYEVMVVSSGGVLADELNFPGSCRFEEPFLFQRDLVSIMKSIRFLRFLLRKWKPNIIHAHSFFSLVQLRLAAKGIHQYRPNLVYSIHGLEKDWSWQMVRQFSPPIADKIIAVSPYHYKLLTAWGFSESQAVYIPNGLPPTGSNEEIIDRDTVRHELGIPVDKILVGTTCRLVERKGVHLLLEGLAKVDPQIYGLIIGDGPELNRLTRLTENLGLIDRVIFTGYRNDARNVMKAFDVFCSLSTWEAFPIVLLEAMQRKIAITCFDWDGAVEILGNAALISPVGDVSSLAHTLNCLAQDASLRTDLADSGYSLFKQRYTMDKVMTELVNVYEELLES